MSTTEIQVPYTSYQQAVLEQNARLAGERLAEQVKTRKAMQVVAWVAGIWFVLSIIGGIIVGVQIARAANVVSSPAGSSVCQSLGGTDTSC